MTLRLFSKITCISTLFLIFAGAMVTSHSAGLAVPDWPLSYGTFFPPMIGGVFYEHGHRMVATSVGLLTLAQAVWIGYREKRAWVRLLGIGALGAVVLQGILGGMTVLFFLPTPVSVSHAMLAQTFFLITILVAYSLSYERERRTLAEVAQISFLTRWSVILTLSLYIQLLLGALMRHTASGLAVPDFPTMGGKILPTFDADMLAWVNDWRFAHGYDHVTLGQIVIHSLHRLGAVIILFVVCMLNAAGLKYKHKEKGINALLGVMNIGVILQVFLGAFTVLSEKTPFITSLHVVTGAGLLGVSFLLLLRAAPLSWQGFKQCLTQN